MPQVIGDKTVFALARLGTDMGLALHEAAAVYRFGPGRVALILRGGVLGPIVTTTDLIAALPVDVREGLLGEHLFLGEADVTPEGRLILPSRVCEAYGLKAGAEIALAAAGERGLLLILRGPILGEAQACRELPRV